MPEKHLFEYAVLRIVPQVEREEFLNTGVILYCPKQKFLRVRLAFDEARLQAFAPSLDAQTLRANLAALERICHGHPDGGPIARLEPAARFRWLTATRSTVLQSSKIHPGLCDDAEAALERLFASIVAIAPC
jgi:hypothetical protein